MAQKSQIFRLKIETGNAAFEDAGTPQEVARILREIAGRIEDRACLPDCLPVYDYNGNRCGEFKTSRA